MKKSLMLVTGMLFAPTLPAAGAPAAGECDIAHGFDLVGPQILRVWHSR